MHERDKDLKVGLVNTPNNKIKHKPRTWSEQT
jgi:hypothetical protein